MRGGEGALALKLNSKRWTTYRAVRSVFDRRSHLTSTAPHTNTCSGRTSRRRDVRPVVSLSRARGRVGEGGLRSNLPSSLPSFRPQRRNLLPAGNLLRPFSTRLPADNYERLPVGKKSFLHQDDGTKRGSRTRKAPSGHRKDGTERYVMDVGSVGGRWRCESMARVRPTTMMSSQERIAQFGLNQAIAIEIRKTIGASSTSSNSPR